MMTGDEYNFPSRRGLVAGAANLALEYLRNSQVLRKDSKAAAETKNVMNAVLTGSRYETTSREVNECLAHARQAMRISYEEWEDVVKVTYNKPKSEG